MKITNIDKDILDLEDKPVFTDEEKTKKLTLRDVIQSSAVNQLRVDANMDGPKKMQLFNIAVETTKKVPEFEIEQLALIKERIGLAWGPLIVGRAYALLEDGVSKEK